LISSIITISIVGLLIGFIGSMPIAGPISILITSNALKGEVRYCNLVTLGASFADLIYVFAAVYGLTKFYSLYKPVIPYVLIIGAVFLLYLGYKIAKSKISLAAIEDKDATVKKRNGLLTGFLLNFLNPTLFLSWLTSSFIVISMVTSLGFNTGGLDKTVDNSFTTINKKGTANALQQETRSYLHIDSAKIKANEPTAAQLASRPKYFPLVLSLSYAFFLSVGGIAWFFLLAYLLAKYRQRININIVNRVIQILGLILCLFGIFLGYKGIAMLL
jgi:threonine/homoserine/homoserine lactone efflux protein